MTPVVTAQLDDPYCLTGMHHWLANWQLRALEASTAAGTAQAGAEGTFDSPEAMRQFGIREYAAATEALEDFTTLWRHGGSPLLRQLVDAGTIELLGGPLSHPFQPLLNPRLREFALREGLADARQRFAHTADRHLGTRMRVRARAWRSVTPQPVSGISWSTARPCTGTPRSAARSATPMWWPSGAICRSATGCGHRSPATPGTPPTATSTPTTIGPV